MSKVKMINFAGHMVRPFLAEKLIKLNEEIRRLNDMERLNATDMAIRMGVAESTMNKWIKILGVKLHNKKNWTFVKKDKWGKIVPQMVKDGKSYEEIAKVLGSSKSVVYLWCCRNDCDRRKVLPNWHGRHNLTK